jgi:gas vesicle protein
MTSPRTEDTSSGFSGLFVLGAIGLGAALMFFLDPDSGKRRRDLVREKYADSRIALQDATEAAVHTAAERTSRAIKRTQQFVASGETKPDETGA